jgi:hypothetical protein
MEAAKAPGRKRGGTHSGRLLLRMPEELHGELARASERAGVSLNAYINDALAQAVGRRPPAAPSTAGERPRTARKRFAERLLVANLVVLVTVGALAVALLVEALR